MLYGIQRFTFLSALQCLDISILQEKRLGYIIYCAVHYIVFLGIPKNTLQAEHEHSLAGVDPT
jgi:hypothetical protein